MSVLAVLWLCQYLQLCGYVSTCSYVAMSVLAVCTAVHMRDSRPAVARAILTVFNWILNLSVVRLQFSCAER